MKNKKWMAGGFVCLYACIAHAGVIAAWDFECGSKPASAAGWTSFTAVESGTLPSSTVRFAGNGSITLSQTDYITIGLSDRRGDQRFSIARPLLAVGDNEMNDGFRIDDQTIGFELSGLNPGQTYRLQFLGVVLDKTDTRDLLMTVGTTTVTLFNNTLKGSTEAYQGGCSPTITYTADATGTINVDFTQNTRGKTHISGLIVATDSGPDATESIAKTAPAPAPKKGEPIKKKALTPTPAPTELVAKETKSGSGTFGLVIIAPILLLLFRLN